MRARSLFLAMMPVVVALSAADAQRVDRAQVKVYGQAEQNGPRVDVWLDRYSYSTGERIRPYFQTEPGAFVTVIRVTSRGSLSVLYPSNPTIQRASSYDLLANDEVPYNANGAFFVNERSGVGFVFAIASYAPFNFRAVANGGRWSTVRLSTNQYDEPFSAVQRFLSLTLAPKARYSVDYISYEVVRSGQYYSRMYSSLDYDDLYFQCLSAYGPRALNYCRGYSQFGYAPYTLGYFPYTPVAPTSGVPSPKMAPPKGFIPDPVVGDEGLKPKDVEPNPGGAVLPQVFRSQPRDASRRADSGDRENARRAEPVEASPSEYRVDGVQRIELRREPSREPSREPAAQQQRYEPPPAAVSQPRYEPRYEPPPRYEAPARLSVPAPAPPPPPAAAPAPPPPPPPAPQHAPPAEPVSREIPSIPPPAPAPIQAPALDR